jgi:hypothetical protein
MPEKGRKKSEGDNNKDLKDQQITISFPNNCNFSEKFLSEFLYNNDSSSNLCLFTTKFFLVELNEERSREDKSRDLFRRLIDIKKDGKLNSELSSLENDISNNSYESTSLSFYSYDRIDAFIEVMAALGIWQTFFFLYVYIICT